MSNHNKSFEDYSPHSSFEEPQGAKKQRFEDEVDENMSDNSPEGSRRANFSNVNGANRNVNIHSVKPTTKKLVIKNFKSKLMLHQELDQKVNNFKYYRNDCF